MENSLDDFWTGLGQALHWICMLIPQFGLTLTSAKFCMKAVWNFNWDIMPDNKKRSQCTFNPNPCCSKFSILFVNQFFNVNFADSNSTECTRFKSYFHGNENISAELLVMVAVGIGYFILLCLIDTYKTAIKKCYDQIYYKTFIDNLTSGKY